MNLAAKLWNRAMDRALGAATGHEFDPSTSPPGGGRCVKCGALCLDVMDDFKAGAAGRCPGSKEPAEEVTG